MHLYILEGQFQCEGQIYDHICSCKQPKLPHSICSTFNVKKVTLRRFSVVMLGVLFELCGNKNTGWHEAMCEIVHGTILDLVTLYEEGSLSDPSIGISNAVQT
jgi:hypothetical protein